MGCTFMVMGAELFVMVGFCRLGCLGPGFHLEELETWSLGEERKIPEKRRGHR